MSTSKIRPSGLYDPTFKPKKQVEIAPTGDPKEWAWKCPTCGTVNTELKKTFTTNKEFICGDLGRCTYVFRLESVPDDIRHWLQDESATPSIDVRPRIVRNQ